jgi:uncharacterized protein YceH (UPF0502 family)
MSSDAPPGPETWEPLPPLERRVLGVLVEKQKTSKSPDAYPMTLNALTTGCNQKSNRDPVLDLTEDVVEETLGRLQRRGLVSKLVGGRVDRWRHLVYEAWRVSKVELAVLAELLLRGPQTEGDLRGRASRMDEIKDMDELRAVLKKLADRRLAVFVTPPDRRGTVVTHGFHAPEELEAATAKFAAGAFAEADTPAARPAPAPAADAVAALDARLTATVGEIDKLRQAVAGLQDQLTALRQELGAGGP